MQALQQLARTDVAHLLRPLDHAFSDKRGNISILRRVEYDLAYIDRWSVSFDLAIVAMTPFSLLMTKNAN